MKTILEINNLAFPIKIEQHPRNEMRARRYRVTYGAEVHDNLFYTEAAMKLGFCIMHALSLTFEMDDG